MLISAITKKYGEVLQLTYDVIQSLKGTTDEYEKDCGDLAIKLFAHAASIEYLSKGTNLQLKEFPDGSHILDVASIVSLARIVFEGYIKLFEVFFEPNSDDEKEYRHCVYQVRGLKLREQYLPQNPDADMISKVTQQIQEIDLLRQRIGKTVFFTGLDKNQKDGSLDGRIMPKRSIEVIAQSAGFGQQSFRKMYAYHSAFAHSDSLSVIQTVDVNASTPAIETSKLLVIMCLAHIISNYSRLYPQALAVCNQSNEYKIVLAIAKASMSMQ